MIFSILSDLAFLLYRANRRARSTTAPGTISTGEPPCSLTGRPASFQWAGVARPFSSSFYCVISPEHEFLAQAGPHRIQSGTDRAC
jgi:hypothetical protein